MQFRNKPYHTYRHLYTKKYFAVSFLLLLLMIISEASILTSCKKLVEVEPPVTSITGTNVYTSDATAIGVLSGIYLTMSSGNIAFATGPRGISFYSGLSADELSLYDGIASNSASYHYYRNSLFANKTTTTPGTEFWSPAYNLIFVCNSAIEGLTSSSTLTTQVKQQLTGEAKFLRAFFYFYLVNLYGDVPLVLTSDYTVNSTLRRSPKEEVYNQIIIDLKDSQALLNENYLNGKLEKYSDIPERVRPTKWVATALLARAYLYLKDYKNSEMEATRIINNRTLFGLTPLNSTFLKNSNEAIWQLQPVLSGWNTEDALAFIIPETGLNDNPAYLSAGLLNSFELNDQRRNNWIGNVTISNDTFYFPYKYKVNMQDAPVTEYLMVFRLSEQYLIRAEARAQLGNATEAVADLNAIRKRAGLANTTAVTIPNILKDIYHERKVELFTEWGHRWFDLKRTGAVNEVMNTVTPLKGGIWTSNAALYPLPLNEILKNTNLTQNPGY
ncbi:RagB/SusD family nutrient uptake outer membrane protein [Chitinophaga agrisoli]|uniref:RagB/SusD family nutrient uptake outer membrane protein n=1 Tax=Chitinophaga agrisoli TaxID=2607653 RepID=A0A5B2VJC8_9BACT|nr:RagB/SusD family nutrient uptake outer membrane protein [Chitinophaga agrisoli]KAA2238788.1 RagB/SusD family nutrient uptake outer membrane protein [Chitinophaga agrisoli]